MSSFSRSIRLWWWLLCGAGAGTLIGQPADDRLLNLSSRGWVGTGAEAFVAGFVIGPGADKPVLIRAVGPRLADFGVDGVLADPTLRLFDAGQNEIARNFDWDAAVEPTFGTVGAFTLNPGSRDAVLLATLPPGLYTAQATGPGGIGNGIGLIEIYDVSGAARLLNLSSRGRVEADRTLVVSGFVVAAGAEHRRLLIRAVGPTLGDYGVEGALSDPSIAVVRSSDNVQIATNDQWTDFSDVAAMEALFTTVGAFPLRTGSADAAAIVELAPGAYTMLVSGVANSAGITLVEVYELTHLNAPAVSLQATTPTTNTEPGTAPGEIVFSRTGDTAAALTVTVRVSGSAVEGVDYYNLPDTVTFAPGAATARLQIIPYGNVVSNSFTKTVEVALVPGDGYLPGTLPNATVAIDYTPGKLFIAHLRPLSGATSIAYGSASIRYSSDQTTAIINLAFAGLSSPQTVAYLRLGTPGDNGAYLLRLPNGQATNVQWDFNATGIYSSADLRQALEEGRIYVSIETANYPTGELAGSFVRNNGSVQFTPPEPPPAYSLSLDDDAAAARFLTQATFGPRPADITRVREVGINAWLNEQTAAPISYLRADTLAEFAAVPAGGRGNGTRPGPAHRSSAWWKDVINGEDQLRQRVAFALSQLFVISIENATIGNWEEGVAHYYDQLLDHAFGNYRDLLETVTRSPMMGIYLSHLRNAKADPETGALPDENYAREIMQLFSIGLNELQPDGTLKLDERGLPIPTYDNATIQEVAKVFTGWTFATANPADDRQFRRSTADYINPMVLFPQFHDDSAKTIIRGQVLPAGQGGAADLAQTLDALFNHPNTGPFVARRLIQRLVTSNPSPGYVHRVATVFANDGTGERGDLGAVVRAILTDYEARSPAVAATPGFGKLKEPLLRLSALFRILPISAEDGRLDVPNLDRDFGQEPMRAPSVFNFFEPDFTRPGLLAGAGLTAPEFQILTDTTAITGANIIYRHLFQAPSGIAMDFSSLLPLANDAPALLARLNLLLAGNQLSDTSRTRLLEAYAALPTDTSDLNRVRTLTYLVALDPASTVQR